MAKQLSLTQLQTQLQAANARWQAGVTSLSAMNEEKQRLHLGLAVNEQEVKRIQATLKSPAPRRLAAFAPERDWRAKDGQDWVTPVRNQGACGTCVAFSSLAMIECKARIQYGAPSWILDLAEADLFFCGSGKKCSEGWWPSDALDYCKNKGVPEETCFPYRDEDSDCSPCVNRAARLVVVDDWQEIIYIDQRKEFLDKLGPVVAAMAIYADFMSYRSGVYHHVTGDLLGYHAVCCIGYSEKDQCWICKNSWGKEWGEEGFFKIAYGEAEMETTFPMWGVTAVSGTLKPEQQPTSGDGWAENITTAYSFDSSSVVILAYCDGQWRQKEVGREEFTLLSPALFQADSVRVFYDGGEIQRLVSVKKLQQ